MCRTCASFRLLKIRRVLRCKNPSRRHRVMVMPSSRFSVGLGRRPPAWPWCANPSPSCPPPSAGGQTPPASRRGLSRLVNCWSALVLPAAWSAGVAFCNSSWIGDQLVQHLAMPNNCRRQLSGCARRRWPWPRTRLRSSALCLTSKPLPLAMTGSPNNAVIAASGLALVPAAGAACVAGAAAEHHSRRRARRKGISFNFI